MVNLSRAPTCAIPHSLATPVPHSLATRQPPRNARHVEDVNIAIDTNPIPHQLWPEVPTGQSAVMYAGQPKVAEARAAKTPRAR